jgi:hypothetical protein
MVEISERNELLIEGKGPTTRKNEKYEVLHDKMSVDARRPK